LVTACFQKHVTEEAIERRLEGTGRRRRRRKQLWDDLKEKILETERGSTRSSFLENSLWNRLRTFRKTDYVMNELIN
jgi:hypothetical protein